MKQLIIRFLNKPIILGCLTGALLAGNIIVYKTWMNRTSEMDRIYELLKDKSNTEITSELLDMQEMGIARSGIKTFNSSFQQLDWLKIKLRDIFKEWIEKSKADNKKSFLFEPCNISTANQDSLFKHLEDYISLVEEIFNDKIVPRWEVHSQNFKRFKQITNEWTIHHDFVTEKKLQPVLDAIILSEPRFNNTDTTYRISIREQYMLRTVGAWFERWSDLPIDQLPLKIAEFNVMLQTKKGIEFRKLSKAELEFQCQEIMSIQIDIDQLLFQMTRIM